MNEEVVFGLSGMGFILVILTLITILAVVVISHAFKTQQTKAISKAEIARDEAYRKLAEEAVKIQQQMTEEQQRMSKDLSEIKKRMRLLQHFLTGRGKEGLFKFIVILPLL